MRSELIALLLTLSFAVAPLARAETAETAETDADPLIAKAQEYLVDIDRIRTEYRELARQLQKQEGDERTVAALQGQRRLVEFMRTVGKLVENVAKQKKKGLDTTHLVQETRTLLWDLKRRIPEFLDSVERDAAELRASLTDDAPNAAVIRAHIREDEDLLDEVVRFTVRHIGYMESLGLNSEKAREAAASRFKTRAGNLSGRLQLAKKRLDAAVAEQKDTGEAAADVAVRDARDEVDRIASSLWTTCDMMDSLDLPTAEYRQVLIETTGEISAHVFDWDVVTGLAEDAWIAVERWAERRAPTLFARVALFAGIMAVFWILGRIARRVVERVIGSSRSNMSELARRMIFSMTSRAVIGIGFFVALSEIGVNVTALLTGLGIAGFIIGFALQETLGNFAAGAMILMYRPFDVGDVIEAGGVMGTVDDMNLVSTTFLTFDNQTLVVPNNRIWGDVIRNVTHQQIRRVDLRFYFAHGTDIERAQALLSEICTAHPAVLAEPEFSVNVQEITQTAVVLVARPWVKTADYWRTYWDLNREATLRFAAAELPMGAPWVDLAQIKGS